MRLHRFEMDMVAQDEHLVEFAVVAEKLPGHADSEKTQERGEGVAILRP